MDSIWLRFSVETIVTSGHGRKEQRLAQGQNRHSPDNSLLRPVFGPLPPRDRPQFEPGVLDETRHPAGRRIVGVRRLLGRHHAHP